jgi:hypothetical protein
MVSTTLKREKVFNLEPGLAPSHVRKRKNLAEADDHALGYLSDCRFDKGRFREAAAKTIRKIRASRVRNMAIDTNLAPRLDSAHPKGVSLLKT